MIAIIKPELKMRNEWNLDLEKEGYYTYRVMKERESITGSLLVHIPSFLM